MAKTKAVVGEIASLDVDTASKEIKTSKISKVVIIDSSFNPEDVIKLDTEGAELMFDQKEDFCFIPDELVGQLSRQSKTRYAIAKQFHATWRGKADKQFQDAFIVDKEYVGSATDKLNKKEIRSGIHTRWARPDKVRDYLAKGYKVMDADEASTFLGSQGGHHEIGRNGKTELILMGIPEEMYKKRQAAKVAANNERARLLKHQAIAEVENQGFRGFDASEDDARRHWTEIE